MLEIDFARKGLANERSATPRQTSSTLPSTPPSTPVNHSESWRRRGRPSNAANQKEGSAGSARGSKPTVRGVSDMLG